MRKEAVTFPRDEPWICWESTSPAIPHYVINPAQLARRVALAARQLAETGALPAHAIRLMPKFVSLSTSNC